MYVMRIAVSCQKKLCNAYSPCLPRQIERIGFAILLSCCLFCTKRCVKFFIFTNIKSLSNQAKLQYALKYQVFKSIFINSNQKGKLLCKCFCLYILKRKTTTVNQLFIFSFVHFADTKNNDKILLRQDFIFVFVKKNSPNLFIFSY